MSDSVYNDLRKKLDLLGYTQTLPLTAIPLVGALFEDVIKATESLRDEKKRVVSLLEEKACWELGAEPYKCDNSRLLAQCNQLHQQLMVEREDFELRVCDSKQKIRNLETDKQHLEEHCENLQQQLKVFSAKRQLNEKGSGTKCTKDGKKPFVTTVRSGERLPLKTSLTETNLRCTKCNEGSHQRQFGTEPNRTIKLEMDKLEKKSKDLADQVAFYMRKVEFRDREISRLNDLLTGGRPIAAIAKDCCYKNVGALSEDLELLQREKSEALVKIRNYQDQMHEAMQRAIALENYNKQLKKELETLKDAALQVETEANAEIKQREVEIEKLRAELKNARFKVEKVQSNKSLSNKAEKLPEEAADGGGERRRLKERLNEMTQKGMELNVGIEKMEKTIQKLKCKNVALQKELDYVNQHKQDFLDEEKIRLKSERDFFQKEYLRLLSMCGSEKEVDFLQSQIKSKDEELHFLRSEVCLRQNTVPVKVEKVDSSMQCVISQQETSRSENSGNSRGSSDCVQAVVLRIERERDLFRKELERIRCERDTLREKHIFMTHMQAEETKNVQQRLSELRTRIEQLEKENRELSSTRLPTEGQIVLLKEELDELKQQNVQLLDEYSIIKMSHNQLKMLHINTERALTESQNKLTLTECQLEKSNTQLNTLDSNRESWRDETAQLRSEVVALNKTYLALENEKDKILTQLDTQTDRTYKLEYELKLCQEKRSNLEKEVNDLEAQLRKLQSKTSERETELQETSMERKSLRQQIDVLKTSRDKAMVENSRLANDLAESQAEILILKKKLKDSETEIERLKQQLRQYVQEVKKAEDLLMHKEKERDEMLEHYRSLSHDAVLLEGNNQSLEVEAAECKRQINEMETEIEALKKEMCYRNGVIDQLEDKVSALNTQNACLERQLEDLLDEQRLLKVNLAACKELCDKLDIEKDKLRAELNEVNGLRKKLEREIEKLRQELENKSNGQQSSVETMEEMLSKTRRDLEEQIQVDSKLSQELLRLRDQNANLLHDLDTERQKRQRQEAFTQEYEIQNLELRHNLTEERFRQAHSADQRPHSPPLSM